MLRDEGPACTGNRTHPAFQGRAPARRSPLDWSGTIKACWAEEEGGGETGNTRTGRRLGYGGVPAGLMGGKPRCWLGGLLLLSVICRMLLMMVGLSAEGPAAGTEEEEEVAGLRTGGGAPNCCCCCCTPLCRSSSRSSSSVV